MFPEKLLKKVRKNLTIQIINIEKKDLFIRIICINVNNKKFNKIKKEPKKTGLNLIYNYILGDYSNKNRILYYKNKLAVFEDEYIELIRNIYKMKKN